MKEVGIVGGGPVGLYSALRLAQLGYCVHLIEKRSFPIDKVCGQGIMPKGYDLLKKVGVDFSKDYSSLFRGVSYYDADLNVNGLMSMSGIGVQRRHLSQTLYEACSKNKFIKIYQEKVIGVEDYKHCTQLTFESGLTMAFKYLLACDGLHSIIRKEVGVEKLNHRTRMGARFHFKQNYPKDKVEVFWGNHIEAYVTPSGEGTSELAFLWEKPLKVPKKQIESFLKQQFPSLGNMFQNSFNDFKVYGPFNKESKKLRYKNIFFIGDSFQFIDGITGEGISLGIRSADYVCQNLQSFNFIDELKILSWYWKYRFFVSFAISLSRFPSIRRGLFKFLQPRQKLFNLVLEANDW